MTKIADTTEAVVNKLISCISDENFVQIRTIILNFEILTLEAAPSDKSQLISNNFFPKKDQLQTYLNNLTTNIEFVNQTFGFQFIDVEGSLYHKLQKIDAENQSNLCFFIRNFSISIQVQYFLKMAFVFTDLYLQCSNDQKLNFYLDLSQIKIMNICSLLKIKSVKSAKELEHILRQPGFLVTRKLEALLNSTSENYAKSNFQIVFPRLHICIKETALKSQFAPQFNIIFETPIEASVNSKCQLYIFILSMLVDRFIYLEDRVQISLNKQQLVLSAKFLDKMNVRLPLENFVSAMQMEDIIENRQPIDHLQQIYSQILNYDSAFDAIFDQFIANRKDIVLKYLEMQDQPIKWCIQQVFKQHEYLFQLNYNQISQSLIYCAFIWGQRNQALQLREYLGFRPKVLKDTIKFVNNLLHIDQNYEENDAIHERNYQLVVPYDQILKLLQQFHDNEFLNEHFGFYISNMRQTLLEYEYSFDERRLIKNLVDSTLDQLQDYHQIFQFLLFISHCLLDKIEKNKVRTFMNYAGKEVRQIVVFLSDNLNIKLQKEKSLINNCQDLENEFSLLDTEYKNQLFQHSVQFVRVDNIQQYFEETIINPQQTIQTEMFLLNRHQQELITFFKEHTSYNCGLRNFNAMSQTLIFYLKVFIDYENYMQNRQFAVVQGQQYDTIFPVMVKLGLRSLIFDSSVKIFENRSMNNYTKSDLEPIVKQFLTYQYSPELYSIYNFPFKPLLLIKSMLKTTNQQNKAIITAVLNKNQEGEKANFNEQFQFLVLAILAVNLFKIDYLSRKYITLSEQQFEFVYEKVQQLTGLRIEASTVVGLDEFLEEQTPQTLLELFQDVLEQVEKEFDFEAYLQKIKDSILKIFFNQSYNAFRNKETVNKNQLIQLSFFFLMIAHMYSKLQYSYNQHQLSCVQYLANLVNGDIHFGQADSIDSDQFLLKLRTRYDLNSVNTMITQVMKLLSKDFDILALIDIYFSDIKQQAYSRKLLKTFMQEKPLLHIQAIETLFVCSYLVYSVIDKLPENQVNYSVSCQQIYRTISILNQKFLTTINADDLPQSFSEFITLITANENCSRNVYVNQAFLIYHQLYFVLERQKAAFQLEEHEFRRANRQYGELLSMQQLMRRVFERVLQLEGLRLAKIGRVFVNIENCSQTQLQDFLEARGIYTQDQQSLCSARELEDCFLRTGQLSKVLDANHLIDFDRVFAHKLRRKVGLKEGNAIQTLCETRRKFLDQEQFSNQNIQVLLYAFIVEQELAEPVNTDFFVPFSEDEVDTIAKDLVEKFALQIRTKTIPATVLQLQGFVLENITYNELMQKTFDLLGLFHGSPTKYFSLVPQNSLPTICRRIPSIKNPSIEKQLLSAIQKLQERNKHPSRNHLCQILCFAVQQLKIIQQQQFKLPNIVEQMADRSHKVESIMHQKGGTISFAKNMTQIVGIGLSDAIDLVTASNRRIQSSFQTSQSPYAFAPTDVFSWRKPKSSSKNMLKSHQ